MKNRRHFWELERTNKGFALTITFQFRHTSSLDDIGDSYHVGLFKKLGFEHTRFKEDSFLDYCEIVMSKEVDLDTLSINENLLTAWPAF